MKTIEKNEKEISSENSKKTVEKISDKTESEHSREIKDEASKKEVQTQKPISISKTNNPQNQKSDHKTRLDLEKKQKLMERYRQETGKRPLYAEK